AIAVATLMPTTSPELDFFRLRRSCFRRACAVAIRFFGRMSSASTASASTAPFVGRGAGNMTPHFGHSRTLPGLIALAVFKTAEHSGQLILVPVMARHLVGSIARLSEPVPRYQTRGQKSSRRVRGGSSFRILV